MDFLVFRKLYRSNPGVYKLHRSF